MEFIDHVLILLSHTVLRRSTSQPVRSSQDRAGPSSELQSLSDSLKSRFNAMSMRFVIYVLMAFIFPSVISDYFVLS